MGLNLFNLFKKSPKEWISKDIGIDLGTATVLVFVQGKGVVLKEPSVVAIDNTTDTITKVGKDAQAMIGRNPENISVVRPLRNGVIDQYDVTLRMIQYFIRRASGNAIIPPRVMICVPTGISDVEERAVIDAGTQAGARKTYLIEEPVAAAIGAGLNIYSPTGHMVVDIGGGTTDAAVISLGGVVVSESVRSAGDKFDEALMSYVSQEYNVLIGERTAEYIKIRIGAVYEHKQAKQISVKGRCKLTGLPREITVSSKEILEALFEPISAIIETICRVIEKTPPELIGDILKNGIVMTGGGSMLFGLDRLIEDVTGIKTRVAKDPSMCVVNGTGRALAYLDNMPEGTIDLSRMSRMHRQKF